MTRSGKSAADPAKGQAAGNPGNIWLRPSRAGRNEQPLTLGRIVDEAVMLLDSEGVKALTMRNLAERLGTGSTTLYWHVKTKDDVLDLALDQVFGEIPLPTGSDQSWRDDIRVMMIGWRATMVRHPWSTALPGRPLLGPNILSRMEFLQRTLSHAGFGEEHLCPMTWCLSNYVMGAARAHVNWHLSREDRVAAQHAVIDRDPRYPTLAAAGYMLFDNYEAAFVEALAYILDGMEAHRAS